jgi:hypothetical protein
MKPNEPLITRIVRISADFYMYATLWRHHNNPRLSAFIRIICG